LLNLCAVSQAARGERVDDFGALNNTLPDPESNPAEARPRRPPKAFLMPLQPLRPAKARRQLLRRGLRIL
jgi:hypothetical protein